MTDKIKLDKEIGWYLQGIRNSTGEEPKYQEHVLKDFVQSLNTYIAQGHTKLPAFFG